MKSVLYFMGADHDKLDNIFRKFRNIKSRDKNKAIGLFRKFKNDLQRHISLEEDILFPLFETKIGMNETSPIYVMKIEHNEIKDLLSKIDNCFTNGDVNTNVLEDYLIKILSEHNSKEESILYPLIDNSIGEDERRDLLIEINKLFSNKS